MKKRLLLFAFTLTFVSQIFAQTVPETQRTLITKNSATWCPPCGGWGWDFFEDLVEDNEEKAVLIVSHHSGSLMSPTSDAFSSNLNGFSQPRFYLNNSDQGATPSNAADKLTDIKNMIDTNFELAPVANAGLIVSQVNDDLEIAAKTEFFQDADGEYYLGVYIVENNIVTFQQSIGNDAVHKKVLRDAVTTETFGDLLANGTIAANTTYEATYTYTPDTEFNIDEMEFVTIVWKKENDKFQVVNVNVVDEITEVTSINNMTLTEASMSIQPNIIADQATINLDVTKDLQKTSIVLYDMFGKKVTDIFRGNLSQGVHHLHFEKTANVAQGMYYVTLQAGEKVATQKVIFR
ncbi:MAG: Omp28-related outer membrane protein [Bacteroidota bacterium]